MLCCLELTLSPVCCRYQYPLQHMEGVPLPPGIPGIGGSTDPLEAVLGPFPCVRLRNLPYDPTLEDILVFFQGLVLIDVVLVGKQEGVVVRGGLLDAEGSVIQNAALTGLRVIGGEVQLANSLLYGQVTAVDVEKGSFQGTQLTIAGELGFRIE